MLPQLKYIISPVLSQASGLTQTQVLDVLELPKKLEHGHLALPVFALAKTLKKAPPLIAQEIADKVRSQLLANVKSVEPLQGFVNITFDDLYLQKLLFSETQKTEMGFSQTGAGQTMVIDYSSPNVAKPLNIGHLRATVIGQAIRNLAETQGYRVIGINHLGDWGVQFGKLAWAYVHWLKEYPDYEKNKFETLLKLYVRFHDEAEKDPALDQQGSSYFKRLEDGDPEIHRIWKMFLDITMDEHEKIYQLLGVKFDLIQGEAFYQDKLEATIDRLKEKNLLQESDGAQVVFLEENMPPCLIRKSDGASLYATRDIASAIYRREVLKGDEIVYVVGSEQSLHFQQVFAVLKKLGYAWSERCRHIAFGLYRFKEGKMSTRKGRVVTAKDVLERAIELVHEVIEEKNPTLKNKDQVAEEVACGAIIFNDLVNDRVRNVDFDWERILNFEGDSGPYVQYMGVRCLSLLRKAKEKGVQTFEPQIALTSDQERHLTRILLNYPDTLSAAYSSYKPNILAQYLLDLCQAFSHFYHVHRILDEEQNIQSTRLALVQCTTKVIESALKVLGMKLPEQM